jgi:hypothetical protein
MRIWTKLALAASMSVIAAGPTFAAFWDCVVPEIDGSAGISALAALASLGMIVYHRRTH